MDGQDQAEEWRRLKEFYARMNDGELEVVADEAYDLTDIARPLLKDEIARRGLRIELRTERGKRVVATASSLPTVNLEVVGTLYRLEDARTAKEFLDVAGIPCWWGRDNVDSLEELTSGVEEGIDLKVQQEDFARVFAGLAPLFPPAEEKDYNFVCPKCQSPEVVFHDMDATEKFNWSCEECGHTWKDDGVQQEG